MVAFDAGYVFWLAATSDGEVYTCSSQVGRGCGPWVVGVVGWSWLVVARGSASRHIVPHARLGYHGLRRTLLSTALGSWTHGSFYVHNIAAPSPRSHTT